jgi:hypothetical protein
VTKETKETHRDEPSGRSRRSRRMSRDETEPKLTEINIRAKTFYKQACKKSQEHLLKTVQFPLIKLS